MAELNKVIKSVMDYTVTPKFISELTILSHMIDSNIEENGEKTKWRDILVSYLNENVSEGKINPNLPPGDYDSTLILIDQVCETILNGIKKGLSVKDTTTLLNIFLKFLTAIIFYDRNSIMDLSVLAEELQKIISNHSITFNKHALKIAVEYLFRVVLPNYQLYSYLLTEEQEKDQTFEQLLVNPIPPSQELSLGCPEDKWHRQQRLVKREAEFENGKKHVGYMQEKMSHEKGQVEQTCNGLLDRLVDEDTGDESLGKVITMVTKMETDVIAKDLLLKVKQTEMQLDFEMDKVNITVVPKKKQKH